MHIYTGACILNSVGQSASLTWKKSQVRILEDVLNLLVMELLIVIMVLVILAFIAGMYVRNNKEE